MKKYSLMIILFSFYMLATAQTNRIEIPITIYDGLGKGTGQYDPHLQMYFGKVAEYATCELNGATYMLSPYGRNYIGYEDFEVILFEESQADMVGRPARRGEFMRVENTWYCFKGVNVGRQVVILEKKDRPQSEIFAMQTGFHPYPFSGSEFSSKDSLSLDQYKGKTLLLMVWSPGCSSCVDKLAPMNDIYASLDPDKVALLGLAIHTDEESLTSVKEEHAVAFPLMLGEHDRINEAYICQMPSPEWDEIPQRIASTIRQNKFSYKQNFDISRKGTIFVIQHIMNI